MKICKSCEEEIPRDRAFESDDEEIFEKVMKLVSDEDVCIECVLTTAVIDQTQSEKYQKNLRWY